MALSFRDRVELWTARCCLCLALLGSAYLAWISLTGRASAGCGPGSGCSEVLSSRWAYWVGVPVSIPAFLVYLALMVATAKQEAESSATSGDLRWIAIVSLSGMVIGAGLWFGFLQYSVLRHWCRFCLATHLSAIVASVCLFHQAFRRGPSTNPEHSRTTGLPLGLGLCFLGFAVLVAGQVLVKKRLYGITVFGVQSGQNPRQLVLFNGRFALDPDELPLTGSNTAPGFVILLFDYTCVHCRRLHPLLQEAATHFKGRLAIIALPAPLDAECNPLIPETQLANMGACRYARLGLAVWHALPSAYREFDDWLFESDTLPSPDQARAKAEALVGRAALAKALNSRWVDDQLDLDVQLYGASSTAMHNPRLPQLIFADAVAQGNIEDSEALEHLVESHRSLARSGP
jgi:uncharacterized membrane protein/protein-disulfide isomerase